MFRSPRQSLAAVFLLLFSSSAAAVAGRLVIDYSHDTSAFFTVGSEARATLERAAADISDVLVDHQLGGLVSNKITGDSNGTTAEVTWSLSYFNPVTGASVSLPNPHLSPGFAEDEIRVFVGWRNLGGITLGQGGPAVNAGLGINGSGVPEEFANAVTAMGVASDLVMTRGSGPIISSFSGTVGGYPYEFDYGSFMGSLWFDSDTNNDSVTDNFSLLDSSWNFGMSLPGPGENDFYSVALHELLHSIGLGSSVSWNALSGDPGVSGGHLVSGLMGYRLSDGLAQEALMSPSLATGSRKSLTTIDLAYLSDIGFVVIPEPGVWGLVMAGVMVLGGRRHRLAGFWMLSDAVDRV
ncbi:MAG: hypothetical protein JWL81_1317 [Verrucomicrobiales bacterium]|nr:hypothetical protein [Verrucomicrobiales bacterium]